MFALLSEAVIVVSGAVLVSEKAARFDCYIAKPSEEEVIIWILIGL